MAGYVGGSDYVFGANTTKGSNAYATGSNQNCGNGKRCRWWAGGNGG